jgi:hypothetical protein
MLYMFGRLLRPSSGAQKLYTQHRVYALLAATASVGELFIIVNALHVSGGFSAYYQELKNYTLSIGYVPSLLAATANVGELEQLTHVSGRMLFMLNFLKILNMGGIILGCKTHNTQVYTISTSTTQSSKIHHHRGFHRVTKHDVTRVAGNTSGGLN